MLLAMATTNTMNLVASHKRISLSDDTAEPMLTVPDPVQATLSVLGCLEVSFCVRPFLDPLRLPRRPGKLGREQPNVDTGRTT